MSSLLLLTLALWSGFSNPPRENRPWCYWYWVNGNVDHATVTSDLEAMKRVGFGGLLLLDPRPNGQHQPEDDGEKRDY